MLNHGDVQGVGAFLIAGDAPGCGSAWLIHVICLGNVVEEVELGEVPISRGDEDV